MVPSADIGALTECENCGGKDPDVLVKPCHSMKKPWPHPSHIRRVGAGKHLFVCDGCGSSDRSVLIEPCRGSFTTPTGEELARVGSPLINGDFSKIEERVLAHYADDKIKRDKLNDALRAAVAAFEAMTPAQQEEHVEAQRQSWMRGEMGLGEWERSQTRIVLTPGPLDAAMKDHVESELERLRKEKAQLLETLRHAIYVLTSPDTPQIDDGDLLKVLSRTFLELYAD
jgi:hypothetical protein